MTTKTKTTVAEGEEVTFQDLTKIADDQLVDSDQKQCEDIIKTSLNALDGVDGKELKYPVPDKISSEVKIMKNIYTSMNEAADAVDEPKSEPRLIPTEETLTIQDLISSKNMNAQIGEIFRAAYRYSDLPIEDQRREANMIKFYIDAELNRLDLYGE